MVSHPQSYSHKWFVEKEVESEEEVEETYEHPPLRCEMTENSCSHLCQHLRHSRDIVDDQVLVLIAQMNYLSEDACSHLCRHQVDLMVQRILRRYPL